MCSQLIADSQAMGVQVLWSQIIRISEKNTRYSWQRGEDRGSLICATYLCLYTYDIIDQNFTYDNVALIYILCNVSLPSWYTYINCPSILQRMLPPWLNIYLAIVYWDTQYIWLCTVGSNNFEAIFGCARGARIFVSQYGVIWTHMVLKYAWSSWKWL